MNFSPSHLWPTPVAIALGSNQGDSLAILTGAIAKLDHLPGVQVTTRSPWYRTRAVGLPQPDYLNGCALLAVTLSPPDLLTALLQLEAHFGRERRIRWGPRTLDLDLLLFGDRVLHTPTLEIPHPRMTERAFVLVPLADIAPHWVEPVSGKTIAALRDAVDCSGVTPL